MSCGEDNDQEGSGTSSLNSPEHGLKTSCVKGGTHPKESGINSVVSDPWKRAEQAGGENTGDWAQELGWRRARRRSGVTAPRRMLLTPGSRGSGHVRGFLPSQGSGL